MPSAIQPIGEISEERLDPLMAPVLVFGTDVPT